MKFRLAILTVLVMSAIAAAAPLAAQAFPTLDAKRGKSLTYRAMAKKFPTFKKGAKKHGSCKYTGAADQCTVGWKKGSQVFSGFTTVQIVGNSGGPGLPKTDYLWSIEYSVGRAGAACIRQTHSQSACVNKSYNDNVYFGIPNA